jgi:hypothetical protein
MENLKSDESRELWPGRYTVNAVAPKFEHRNKFYRDVPLKFYQVDIPEGDEAGMMSECDDESCGCGEEGAHAVAINETFTEEQARQLKTYLLERYHKEGEVKIEPAYKPAGSEHWHPNTGEFSDILSLFMAEGYRLPFKVEAFYDVKGRKFMSDSELLQKQAREALSCLSLEDLKMEKVWLDNLIEQKSR